MLRAHCNARIMHRMTPDSARGGKGHYKEKNPFFMGPVGGAVLQLARRPSVVVAAASPVEESVAYSKAFAAVLSRRLVDTALDAASQVQLFLAEVPVELQSFQADVERMAQKEITGGLLPAQTSGGSSSGSSNASSSSNGSKGNTDLAALVDILRSDIAESRTLIQQIKLQTRGSGTCSSSSSSSRR